MNIFGKDSSGLYNSRLSRVIDCGTIDGVRHVYINIQLEDFDVVPKDSSLPVYKLFAKVKYNKPLPVDSKLIKNIALALGYSSGDILDFLVSKAGSVLKVNIESEEYNSKYLAIIKEEGHLPSSGSLTEERGVDFVGFKFSGDTTLQDIEALGFDKKHVKKSIEYRNIITTIDDIF